MRIFCWNVNSLVPTVRNISLKYGSLAAFFKHLDADIVCFQEVKLPYSKLSRDLVVVEGYQSYWACSEGKTGYSGCTTWARQWCAALSAEADALMCHSCQQEGRVIETDHGSFVLLNVYVPNAGDRPDRPRLAAKVDFLTALKERIDCLLGKGKQVIAVGDFNVAAETRDVHEAIHWGSLYDASELAALHALLGSVSDTWRRLHPGKCNVFTVWDEKKSARSFNVGLRIDYMLCSAGLHELVTGCEVMLDLPPKWSDHAPLMLELQLPEQAAAAAAAGGGAVAPAACQMWVQLLRRFQDPSQRSIAAMFKAAKPKQPQTATGAPSRAVAATTPAAATAAGSSAGDAEAVQGLNQAADNSAAAAGARKRAHEATAATLEAANTADAEVADGISSLRGSKDDHDRKATKHSRLSKGLAVAAAAAAAAASASGADIEHQGDVGQQQQPPAQQGEQPSSGEEPRTSAASPGQQHDDVARCDKPQQAAPDNSTLPASDSSSKQCAKQPAAPAGKGGTFSSRKKQASSSKKLEQQSMTHINPS